MDVWVKGHGISALSWKQENMDKKKGTKNDLRIAFCFFFVHMLLHDRFKESPSQLWQLVSHMSYYIRQCHFGGFSKTKQILSLREAEFMIK